jgi:plastocyanin
MLRHRIPGSIIAMAAVLALAPGCSSGEDTTIPTMTLPMPKLISDEKVEGEVKIVTIRDHKFNPAELTIQAGDAVKWVFKDKDAHTATGLRDKGMIINSPVLREGSEYQVVFNTPEEIDYICAIHPEMKGKIIVEPKPK